MLIDQTVKEFTHTLASDAPVPGGGSVAALSGALAAALAQMVAALTKGKKKYADQDALMGQVIEEMTEKTDLLLLLIDRDAQAFDGVMAAFRLEKDTEEKKALRAQRIQEATLDAAQVPLEVARICLGLMEAIETVIEKGNPNAITDGAVACMMARTATLAALYNVEINLSGLKDEALVDSMSTEMKHLRKEVTERERLLLEKVVLS